MLIGRFLFLIPLLAAAGSLARKKKIPATSGTLPTHGPLFVTLLVGTVVLVGALTFFPALALGPIVEHYLMQDGKLFAMLLNGIGAKIMPTSLEQEPIATNTAPGFAPTDPGSLLPHKLARSRPLFDPEIVRRATKDSFVKLNPVTLLKNPVMFVVEVGAALTTLFLIRDLFTHGAELSFQIQISLWLWFTVLFANFAEAMAEARGKAQADTLRKTKSDSHGQAHH